MIRHINKIIDYHQKEEKNNSRGKQFFFSIIDEYIELLFDRFLLMNVLNVAHAYNEESALPDRENDIVVP